MRRAGRNVRFTTARRAFHVAAAGSAAVTRDCDRTNDDVEGCAALMRQAAGPSASS